MPISPYSCTASGQLHTKDSRTDDGGTTVGFAENGGQYSGEKNEYLKSLNQCRLLIIDDLGVERDTSYVLETVFLRG